MNVLLELRPHPESDEDERERLIRRLRIELTELDVDGLRPVPGASPPAGAKGDPVTAGALVLALTASGGVLVAIIETLKDWLAWQSARHRISVTIDDDTIELAQATADQRQDLVDAFVRRHAPD